MKMSLIMEKVSYSSLDTEGKIKDRVEEIVDKLRKQEDVIDNARKELYDILDEVKAVSSFAEDSNISRASEKNAILIKKSIDLITNGVTGIGDAWNAIYVSTLK
jgi:hypothetical protein